MQTGGTIAEPEDSLIYGKNLRGAGSAIIDWHMFTVISAGAVLIGVAGVYFSNYYSTLRLHNRIYGTTGQDSTTGLLVFYPEPEPCDAWVAGFLELWSHSREKAKGSRTEESKPV